MENCKLSVLEHFPGGEFNIVASEDLAGDEIIVSLVPPEVWVSEKVLKDFERAEIIGGENAAIEFWRNKYPFEVHEKRYEPELMPDLKTNLN